MNVKEEIINKLKRDSEVYIITDDDSYQKTNIISFNNEIMGKVTNKKCYENLNSALKYIDYKNFGDFNFLDEVLENYKNLKGKVIVYKIKKESEEDIEITDEDVLKLIDINTFQHIQVGFSSAKVLNVKLKDGKDAILKINFNKNENSLKKDYTKMKWLYGKIKCPKIYLWKETEKEVLLMECMKGVASYNVPKIGFRLGEELKKIHSLDIKDCPFHELSVENLLAKAIENLDASLMDIKEIYPDENKESIIKFLKENAPKDHVLCHGDFSMPNIMVDGNDISFIDLGNAGVTTKYLDIYDAIRSLKMNGFDNEINDFLKGYGLEKIDDNYFKWMKIVDKTL